MSVFGISSAPVRLQSGWNVLSHCWLPNRIDALIQTAEPNLSGGHQPVRSLVRALQLGHESIVFGMRTDPVPNDCIAVANAYCSKTDTDPGRKDRWILMHPLEVKPRMPRVVAK